MKILTIQLLCHRLFLALCLSIGVRLCAFPSVCVYRVSGDNPPLLLYYTLHNVMWQMQIQIHLSKYKYKCCQIQIFADANSKLMCVQKRCLVTTVGSCSIYYILLVQNTFEVKIQIQVKIQITIHSCVILDHVLYCILAMPQLNKVQSRGTRCLHLLRTPTGYFSPLLVGLGRAR